MFRPFVRATALLSTSSSVILLSPSRKMSNMTSYKITPFDVTTARWPYSSYDFQRGDESSDMMFYSSPRFVHHIDDNAVLSLTEYYTSQLPAISSSSKKPTILDICSSWTSHLPANTSSSFNIHGMGMSRPELAKNPELKSYVVKDMNDDPEIDIPAELTPIAMTMCTVSIDYLNKPLEVLASIARKTEPGGKIHLAISNRCFPTKVVKWWTFTSEEERLQGVCRYLHFAGSDVSKEKKGKGGGLWEKIEIVEVVGEGQDQGGNDQGFKGWLSQFRSNDPLWVVRATRTGS